MQSSRVATQLAGLGRGLGPPDIAGSVCRRVRPLLDLAVCIPSEQISHRTLLSHLKGSELFEILPYESEGIVGPFHRPGIETPPLFVFAFGFSAFGEAVPGIGRALIRVSACHNLSTP